MSNSGQGKTASIPANKSRSKVKPLEEKIQSFEIDNEELLEEMYEKGIRIRPSLMTPIEEKEAEALKYIQFCIAECEKETGRKVPFGYPTI